MSVLIVLQTIVMSMLLVLTPLVALSAVVILAILVMALFAKVGDNIVCMSHIDHGIIVVQILMNVSLIHLPVPVMLSVRIQLVTIYVLVMLAILAMALTAQVYAFNGPSGLIYYLSISGVGTNFY